MNASKLSSPRLPIEPAGSGDEMAAFKRTFSGRMAVLSGLALLLCLRLMLLAICPLELVPDEAYYWDWSRQLDWSYYSKPPMVAWLIALATAIGGHDEFAIRVPAAILGTVGLWPIYELGRRMYDERTGLWATLIAAATPGLTAMSLLMTIDAPFLCAWAFAVCCMWRLVEIERPGWRWVMLSILATGFGLLSKQTMLGLFPLLGLYLITGRDGWSGLRSRAVWGWALGSLMFLIPVVWWNWRHDWITVEHTREHFQAASATLLQRIVWYAEFWGSQFVLLSPLVCGLVVLVCCGLIPKWRQLDRRERFLLCFGGVPMVAVTALSLCQRVQPNWPAALHLTSLVLLAAWGCRALPNSSIIDRGRVLFRPAVACGAVMSLLVALVPLIVPASPWAGTSVDPTSRLRGWRELGMEADRMLQDFPHSSDTLVIASTARGPVSELAFYLPSHPRVYRWNSRGVVTSQHDVWGGPTSGGGRDALIVTQESAAVPARLAAAFESVEERGRIVIPLGPDRTRAFRVWRGVKLREWPRQRGDVETVAVQNVSSSN